MSFRPQGHMIPAEIQPRITVPFATDRDRTTHIRGSPQHLTAEHQKLVAPELNPSMARMDERKTL